MSDVEDPVDAGSDAGDDLFGDGDDGAIVSDIASEHPRSRSRSRPRDAALSEDDKATEEDDDEDDDDRSRRNRSYGQRDRSDTEQRVVLEMALYRHALPKPEDGEVVLFHFSRCSSFKLLTLYISRYVRSGFLPSSKLTPTHANPNLSLPQSGIKKMPGHPTPNM